MTGDGAREPGIVSLPWSSADVVVRTARPEDDLDALHLEDRMWQGNEQWQKFWAAMPPGLVALNLVAERRGTAVGHATLVAAPMRAGGMGWAEVQVPSKHQGMGAGRALVEVMTRQCALSGLPGCLGQVDAADAASRAALAALGGREQQKHQESGLDLTSLDRQALQGHVDRVRGDAIRVAPLPDDATEQEWTLALQLFNSTRRDTPDIGAQAPDTPMEIFRASAPDPWMVELAWDGDHAVGMTCVYPMPDPDTVYTGLTGVLPEARGRGIATALKADHALRLADRGFGRIITWNMEGNTPILAANARLGFVPGGTWIDVVLPSTPGVWP